MNSKRSYHPLDLVHSYVWGASTVPNISRARWILSLTNEWTRVTWIFFSSNKNLMLALSFSSKIKAVENSSKYIAFKLIKVRYIVFKTHQSEIVPTPTHSSHQFQTPFPIFSLLQYSMKLEISTGVASGFIISSVFFRSLGVSMIA